MFNNMSFLIKKKHSTLLGYDSFIANGKHLITASFQTWTSVLTDANALYNKKLSSRNTKNTFSNSLFSETIDF